MILLPYCLSIHVFNCVKFCCIVCLILLHNQDELIVFDAFYRMSGALLIRLISFISYLFLFIPSYLPIVVPSGMLIL